MEARESADATFTTIMERFSAYEYLSFIIPGGLVLVVAFYGWYGWPYGEPGISFLAGILATAFILGHAIAALANVVAPAIWGHRPTVEPHSYEGAFAKGGYLHGLSQDDVLAVFVERVGDYGDLDRAFKAAAKRMQAEGRAERLDIFNQQIGFYRNCATACLLSSLIVIAYEIAGPAPARLFAPVWVPVFGLCAFLFSVRYRRFWYYYGREVWLDVKLKPPQAHAVRKDERPDA